MRLINADDLIKEVVTSMKTNPHKEHKISSNHTTEYIHFLELIDKQPEIADGRIEQALKIAFDYGQIDDEQHKAWAIDQIVRVLCGNDDRYNSFINMYEKSSENECYWNSGIEL